MSIKGPARKQVLGIVGSPRRGGNTDILVDEALAGAEEAGALVEKVVLSKLDIAPCRACNVCQKTGQCVQKDDMPALLEQMQRSQVWVLGTPVYWWGPTAQFKIFLDRWYGARQVTFAGRHVILAIPLGGSAGYAQHTVGMLTDTLDYLRTELVATVLAPGAYDLGAVRRHADVLTKARRAGREAIRTQTDKRSIAK
jgi:multimeric flavodoxin WrbA